MNKRIFALTSIIVILVLALFVASLGMPTAQAAPPAAPTPISATSQLSPRGPMLFSPFAGTVLIADTEATCVDIADYTYADVMYQVDQGTTNTVTISPRWSNDGNMVALGATAVSANAADTTDIVQIPLFSKYMCLYADVTNTNPVTLTVQVLAK